MVEENNMNGTLHLNKEFYEFKENVLRCTALLQKFFNKIMIEIFE